MRQGCSYCDSRSSSATKCKTGFNEYATLGLTRRTRDEQLAHLMNNISW